MRFSVDSILALAFSYSIFLASLYFDNFDYFLSLPTSDLIVLDEALELLDMTELSLLLTLELVLYLFCWGEAGTNTLRYNLVRWACEREEELRSCVFDKIR